MTGREESRREGKLRTRRIMVSLREGITVPRYSTSARKGRGKFGSLESFKQS